MKTSLLVAVLVALVVQVTCFEFKNIFSNQGTGPQQHHFGQKIPKSRAKAPEQVCQDGYLCAKSKKCVSKPIDCPCPNVSDIKCRLGSDWYVCIRGDQDCDEVQRTTLPLS
ncbi:hypothetical protein BC940DRAFT_315596 [Gongronella butleri]|nr:hypothetical protein BC940DRAFT_315596 [Gongronella butleri]